MSLPHLRRRYRAVGARSGLTYLFLALAPTALYVGLRVYTARQQGTLDALQKQVDLRQEEHNRLLAERDRLVSLAEIRPRAEALGLEPIELNRMARLPLSAPAIRFDRNPVAPVSLAEAAGRLWRWLDPPTPSAQEALAGE